MNRQPKFLRHLVEKFLLKGDEANACLLPCIQPIWDTQPIGVTRLPVSAMFIGGYSRDTGNDQDNIPHTAPTTYSLGWRRTANGVVTIMSNIARGEIVKVEADISLEVTPTSPITCQVHVTNAASGVVHNLLTVFNPIGGSTVHLETPYLWQLEETNIGIRVATISGVGQAIEFDIKVCIFPNRESN